MRDFKPDLLLVVLGPTELEEQRYAGDPRAHTANDLAFMVTGMYGHPLPKQDGAPLRLATPWKYGFKNVKSIVKIEFLEKQPTGSWTKAAMHEYGFYSNVNPHVDHPRWSQKRERLLPALFASRETELFNGYGEQVASLYAGMDLKANF